MRTVKESYTECINEQLKTMNEEQLRLTLLIVSRLASKNKAGE